MEPRKDLVLLGAFIAFGLVASTWIATHTHKNGGEIAVKGYAERRIKSDLGVWRGRFSVRGPELVPAYAELEKQSAIVSAWLQSQGAKGEMSSVYTTVEHKLDAQGHATNEIEDYVLTQNVEVEGTDVALITRIGNKSTELIQKGVAFESDQPLWFYTKLNDLKIQMLGDAAHDARVRAEKIADEGHGDVGSLRSADQGVFQITAPTSTEVSGSGELDTSSVEKSVKAIVTVRYGLD